MHTFTSIIFLGPGTELNPICNVKYPKFLLPVLNEPLLLHNLRWMEGISNEIIVVGLEKYKKMVHNIIQESNLKTKTTFIELLQYDGTYHNLKEIIKGVKTTNVLITKGDIISFIKLKEIANVFLKKKTNIFVILKEEKSNSSVLGLNEDSIVFYNTDLDVSLENKFFLDHNRIKFTMDLDVAQVYFMRVKVFEEIEGKFFSLKSNLLPVLVREMRMKTPVRFFYSENEIFQVQKYSDLVQVTNLLRERTKNLPFFLYQSELQNLSSEEKSKHLRDYNLQNKNFIFKTKNRISFPDDKNIVGGFLQIDKAFLKNTTVGHYCSIENETTIEDSLVFNDVKIGKNCKIRRCLIGNNVVICDGCVLIDCKITNDFKLVKKISAEGQVFIGNDSE